MSLPGLKRLPLALGIAAFHAWVFLSGRSVPVSPVPAPLAYMEIWNVATPHIKRDEPGLPALAQARPKSNSARRGAAREQAPAPAAGRSAPAVADALPEAMTPGLAPSATATPTAPEVADALHQPYSAAPRPLDVDGLRALARADEKSRVKTPLEKLHEREHIVRNIESKVADGAARAARKNCQTDYAGGGVFAIVPLLYGTLTDDGCKWK